MTVFFHTTTQFLAFFVRSLLLLCQQYVLHHFCFREWLFFFGISPCQDEREVKREKRKQSNRESARRSRLRKQAETEELATQVESLTAENTSLKSEIGKLTKSSEKLRIENSALVVKLKGTAAPTSAEMPLDKTAVAAPSSSPRVVENFLSMIDDTSKSGVKNHMEHSEPKLRQLLGSSATTDVVAANWLISLSLAQTNTLHAAWGFSKLMLLT